MPFNHINVTADDARALTGVLETELVKTGVFDVIEQTQMESILGEQEYSLRETTSEETAVRLGRLLSAERIVLGTLSQVGGRFVLTAKLIDVESGRNVSADRLTVNELGALPEEMELEIGRGATVEYRPDPVLAGVGVTLSEPETTFGEERAHRDELALELEEADRRIRALEEQRGPRRVFGLTLLGTGGAGLLTGAVTFLMGNAAYNDYMASTDPAAIPALRSRYEKLDLIALISGGVAAAGGVSGGITLLLAPDPANARAEGAVIATELSDTETRIATMEEVLPGNSGVRRSRRGRYSRAFSASKLSRSIVSSAIAIA